MRPRPGVGRTGLAVRILVTNDDGVFAPGIAALARGLADAAVGDVVVVAPLVDHSGAGAAVGAVYERETIPYESVEVRGLEDVATFGIDGPPALAVILACIGGFGPPFDLVLSGVNHGVNAGRSALHSGTVGAALTAAQFGLRALAVSVAWGSDPVPWETPVGLAVRAVPVLATAAPSTVLNLNVPAVTPDGLRGVRHAGLGSTGLIRAARRDPGDHPADAATQDRTGGAISLVLRGGDGSDPDAERREADPGSDAAALADGWATLTALVGIREDSSAPTVETVAKAVAALAT
ncbi:MAG: 5'/3'-nucleotidase SurE [Acidimicrobiales bacterium]